jgi:hypothetical protein
MYSLLDDIEFHRAHGTTEFETASEILFRRHLNMDLLIEQGHALAQ